MGEELKEELLQVETLTSNRQLEEARNKLLVLVGKYRDDPLVNYLCGSVHDGLGLEREAIPYYERALRLGVDGIYREEAFIQLGSSYRCISQYAEAKEVLEKGLMEFPENQAILVFLAMTYYNLGLHKEADAMFTKIIAETSSDKWINKYRRAIKFYSDRLDETW